MQKTLKILFFTAVGALSLGQFANISQLFGVFEPKIYLFDLILIIFAILGSFHLFQEKKPVIPTYLLGFYIFSGIALVSLIPVGMRFGTTALITALAYFLRWLSYLVSATVIYNLIVQGSLKVEDILKAFLASGIFLALAGFVQLAVLPDFTKLDPILGWDPHKNRLAATFFDPNFVGGYLVLLITTILFKREQYLKFITSKRLTTCLIVLLTALFFTYSRSAWGMFVVITFFYGLRRSVWLIITAGILAFSAYYAIPRIQTRIAGITDPADSAAFRLVSWKDTLGIYEDNKFLGVGFNAMKSARLEAGQIYKDIPGDHSASGSDSSFLLVLATTGLLGFVIFTVAYFLPLTKPDFYKLALILGIFLQTQFINALFYPQIMFFWLILFSLLCIL